MRVSVLVAARTESALRLVSVVDVPTCVRVSMRRRPVAVKITAELFVHQVARGHCRDGTSPG